MYSELKRLPNPHLEDTTSEKYYKSIKKNCAWWLTASLCTLTDYRLAHQYITATPRVILQQGEMLHSLLFWYERGCKPSSNSSRRKRSLRGRFPTKTGEKPGEAGGERVCCGVCLETSKQK